MYEKGFNALCLGDFSTILLPFPRPLKSPLIKNIPIYMKEFVSDNHAKNAGFDKLLEELFPPTEKPKQKFTGERSVSLRILKIIILNSSKTKCNEDEIESYLFKIASPDSNSDHPEQTPHLQPL